MFRFFFLQSILLFHCVPIPAQQTDFSKIDRWASNQVLTDTAIVKFTKELTSIASTDLQKIRAIYQFVIHHVSYEEDVSDTGNKRTNRSLYDIIKRKRGICWDYALLITEMSRIAGLDCHIVSGWGRDISRGTEVSIEPNHAWNIILLDSNYYLLDATWSSATLENMDAFQRKYKTEYFLTPPHLFMVNHYPVLSFLQLLNPPVTFSDWSEYIPPIPSPARLPFATRDTISSFFAKGRIEQRLVEAEAAFEIRPGTKNQEALGHTLFDLASTLKDSADLKMDENNTSEAISYYQQSIAYFEKANQLSQSYPWQKEAEAFCHLNYAQALYRMNYQQGRKHLMPVAQELRSAQVILNQLDTTNFVLKSALHQIQKQLQSIE